MNERIKELAEQAEDYADDNWGSADHDDEWFTAYNEKFAELIVRECADLCDRYQEIPATTPRHCANDIRLMFGVEK